MRELQISLMFLSYLEESIRSNFKLFPCSSCRLQIADYFSYFPSLSDGD